MPLGAHLKKQRFLETHGKMHALRRYVSNTLWSMQSSPDILKSYWICDKSCEACEVLVSPGACRSSSGSTSIDSKRALAHFSWKKWKKIKCALCTPTFVICETLNFRLVPTSCSTLTSAASAAQPISPILHLQNLRLPQPAQSKEFPPVWSPEKAV